MKPYDHLNKGLQKLGISCSEKQLSAFMTYLAELKKWNKAYNLTALKTDEDIIIKHFLDSLLYLKALPEGALKLADAGTGAGFPGIPLKIVRPEIDLTLVESSRKKAAFLRHLIRQLKPAGTTVLEQRLENLGRESEKTFDVIVSRAAFSIKEFLGAACPYVREGGILVLNKGPKVSEEVRELDGTSYAGTVKNILTPELPLINAVRNLVVLECTYR
ncbi:MAG: 16S rRNA (guanine(527)-N(7))-methyltransferase RsmG [Nitrospirae bacterium]|nr:16S rRNA (guanine(527)-N(7))-methyltransferase RsmG [Nitrospirota bacterium]